MERQITDLKEKVAYDCTTRPLSCQGFDYGRVSTSRLVLHSDQAGCGTALFFGSFFWVHKRKNQRKRNVTKPNTFRHILHCVQNDRGNLADAGEILRLCFAALGMSKNGKTVKTKNPDFHRGFRCILTWLTDLGSNQDSSEPKSDVLPVTPSVKTRGKNNEIHITQQIMLRRLPIFCNNFCFRRVRTSYQPVCRI